MSPASRSSTAARSASVVTGAALILGLLAAGCAGPGSGSDDAAGLCPSLEEIFLIPGIHGQPPRARSLSADGQWLLLDWNPVATDAEGVRTIEERGSLRLMRADDPAASDWHGTPLTDLLATPEDRESEEPRSPAVAWTHRGHTLAVAWAGDVWRSRAPDGEGPLRFELVWRDPEPPAEDDDDAESEAPDPEPEPEEEPPFEERERPTRLGRVSNLRFTPDDRALEVRAGGELYVLPMDGALPVELSSATWLTEGLAAGADGLQWSDDRSVAFSPRHALGHLDRADGDDDDDAEEGEDELDPAQIRRDGGALVALEGFADAESLQAARLSPDGRWVMARTVDESSQPEPTLVPDYLTTRVSTRKARNQWAEDVASPREYVVWDAITGERSSVELADDEGTWLSDVGWAPIGASGDESVPARYAWRRLSADFRTMGLWVWSAGEARRVFSDRDERWFGGPAAFARWSADGRYLLYGSESTPISLTPGRSQLFAIDSATGAARQLTEVTGEVSSFTSLEDGSIVFTASDANPARRFVGVVPSEAVRGELAATRTWERALPVPAGMNGRPLAAQNGGVIVFEHEELGVPGELWSVPVDGKTPAARLSQTIPTEYAAVDWIRPVKFEAARAASGEGDAQGDAQGDAKVRAHIYLPRGTSLERPDRARPCIVFIHGAGYLQNVTDSMTEYQVNLMFHSRLASLGYVVVDVDYRGSEGYGNDFRTRLQYHLGGLDLDDIHLVVDALAREHVVDPERVGCYGGSYGGFLTLMALFTAPERWRCGAALRSVTDWRTYHPRYTQPRLGRPSTHPEAFERSSPIDHAEQLEDPLLILHGMVDTNVFAQDSIRLMEALIDEGLDFDAMLYPSQGHAFSDGPHWVDEYGRIERFLTEHLGPP